jgi:F0F1-type ATP synthase assembly protein I
VRLREWPARVESIGSKGYAAPRFRALRATRTADADESRKTRVDTETRKRGSVSQPPELPGTRRLKRAAASAGSSAYQGVFEAVGAILIACGVGFWIDRFYETGPVGVLVGAAVGFGAFVLRLMRLGKELHPDSDAGRAASGLDGSDGQAATSGIAEKARDASGSDSGGSIGGKSGGRGSDDGWIGQSPGMSDVLRDDPEYPDESDEQNTRDRFDRGGRDR